MAGFEMLMLPRQEFVLKSCYQTACEIYENSRKINIDVNLRDLRFPVKTALVSRCDLENFLDGEKFAGTIGGMFFVTREMPEQYRKFAAFHELAEHAASKGFDVTGLAKHFQAVVVELGYAKTVLGNEEFQRYLEWRKSGERTNFFKIEHGVIVNEAASIIYDIFQTLPQFLTYRRKQLVELVSLGVK